eukprot:139976-Rhodomonas_salina.1
MADPEQLGVITRRCCRSEVLLSKTCMVHLNPRAPTRPTLSPQNPHGCATRLGLAVSPRRLFLSSLSLSLPPPSSRQRKHRVLCSASWACSTSWTLLDTLARARERESEPEPEPKAERARKCERARERARERWTKTEKQTQRWEMEHGSTGHGIARDGRQHTHTDTETKKQTHTRRQKPAG